MSVGYRRSSATALDRASSADAPASSEPSAGSEIGLSAPSEIGPAAPNQSSLGALTGRAPTAPAPRAAPSARARPAERGKRSASSRVRQIDALRVLSCFSVITVHAVGGPFPTDSVGLGETNFLLHYSREIFFFVSALVLVRTYFPRIGPDGRLPDENAFRLRRLRLIGVPYLWWTTLYLGLTIFHARASEPFGATLDDLPLRWLILVATGNASYHMYFLLVTLQFGVLFPLVLRVLARTEGRHGRLLAASAALQLATLACYHWVLLPDAGWRGLLGDASLPAYQLWLVAGAVAGLHLESWHRWVVEHRRMVLAAVPVAAAVLLWCYWAQVPGKGALGASSPLQPVMMLWSVAALGALYLLAVSIMQRGPDWLRDAFSYGAQLSFGVYLAHPMVLDLVLAALRRTGLMRPSVWVSLTALGLTVVITVAICAALHRTRLSLPLMGRPRLTPASSAVGVPARRSVVAWRRRLPELRDRLVTVPSAVLAASVLGVLLIGGDQTPPSETSRPSWEETVEASSAAPPSDDGGCSDVVTAVAVGPPSSDTPSDAASAASTSAGVAYPSDGATDATDAGCTGGTTGQ